MHICVAAVSWLALPQSIGTTHAVLHDAPGGDNLLGVRRIPRSGNNFEVHFGFEPGILAF